MPALRNFEIKASVGYLPFVPNHHLLPRSEISGFFILRNESLMVRDEIWVKTDQLWVETHIFDRLPVFL